MVHSGWRAAILWMLSRACSGNFAAAMALIADADGVGVCASQCLWCCVWTRC